jgi:HAE1 family hydrophobic/amphiphilic exporter-1
MEVALLPDIQDEALTIWIPYPDAGVPEVEEAVARPAEDALAGVRGVSRVRARVVPGGVTLVLRLYPGADAEIATLGAREKLDALRWELPDGAGRPLVLGGSNDDRAMMVLALAAADLQAAGDWAETVLRPRLEQLDGVARVQPEGVPQREVRVVLDPERLRATGVGVEQVGNALRAANAAAPGGVLRRRGLRYALHLESELRGAADIERVRVGGTPSQPILVRDVGRVEQGTAEADGWSRLDGAPAVALLVFPESGANLLRTAARVHERLQEVQREFPDFQVAVVEDAAPFVRQSISNLWQAVWLGGLLAFGVLLYFLNDVRSPVVLMTTLPVAVLGSFAALDALGVSLNLMTLGGMALSIGTLVDNSIICLDNIHRLRGRGMHPARAAAEGAREVSLPMLASTFTTLSVFVPLAWVPGRIGALFHDQAIAIAVSQLVSLLASLTLLPMLAARIAPARGRRRERLPLYGLYHRVLIACLRRPAVLLATLVVLLGASVAFLWRVPREILPEIASDTLALRLELPAGSDASATDAAVRTLEAWLREQAGVTRLHATVGDAGAVAVGSDDRAPNRALLRARLDRHGLRQRRGLEAGVRELAAAHPQWGLELLPSRPEIAGLFLNDEEAALQFELTGPDALRAEELAAAIATRAALQLGAAGRSLRLQAAEGEPRTTVRLREEALWRYGVSREAVVQALRSRTSGFESTRLRRFDREEALVLRDPGDLRGDLVVEGRVLPLAALVELRQEIVPARALRNEQARVAAIRWEGDLTASKGVEAALVRAAQDAGLPPGYAVRFTGGVAEMRGLLSAVVRIFALSAGLVFLILAAQFESLRLPLIVFTDIPLALIGVALALGATGSTLNLLSGAGMVVLNGVVVNDSILKVDLLRRLQQQGVPRLRAVLRVSRRHYRPIWMTTAVTVLGLIPLCFGTGAEIMRALAVAYAGGLVISTILTLLVIPVIFHRIAGDRR